LAGIQANNCVSNLWDGLYYITRLIGEKKRATKELKQKGPGRPQVSAEIRKLIRTTASLNIYGGSAGDRNLLPFQPAIAALPTCHPAKPKRSIYRRLHLTDAGGVFPQAMLSVIPPARKTQARSVAAL